MGAALELEKTQRERLERRLLVVNTELTHHRSPGMPITYHLSCPNAIKKSIPPKMTLEWNRAYVSVQSYVSKPDETRLNDIKWYETRLNEINFCSDATLLLPKHPIPAYNL